MDLAIDGGQTGLRLGLSVRGQVQEIRETPGLSYAEGSPADAVLGRIGTGWGELDTICLGLTTILDHPDELAGRLLQMARRVMITTDVVTSHAGAFSGAPGVVLAAGTGAIALAVTTEPTRSGRPPATRQVDGWGHLYGDAGGGFWIGRRGLDAAYRGFDGRAEPGPLTEHAREVFGDLAELPAELYLSPDAVARVARFAVHVLELTDDGTASAIVEEAARELATTVAAAARGFPEGTPVPVAWTGRLLRDPTLRARFKTELAALLPQARLQPAAGDSLAGAALLAAADDPGPYRTLIRTVRR
ncbi:BadF/BadG/BcrA/BcrD ATPase family protein [Nonomuraea sp. NPDC005983]|uniref:BadF/BadG/BcrA/BcrD ATPase family protein n=1 Tax=Nonomuraea sp. NPDC005983 TaxID=3155595 RepID=UPI00339E44BE